MQKPKGSEKQIQRQKKAYKARQKHRRRQLQAKRSQVDPTPAPRGYGYMLQQMWDKLGLEAAMEKAGIIKDGVPVSTVFMLVILMGIVGASSLHGLVDLIPQDAVLMAVLGIQELEEKHLYRGLARVSIDQYQQWMSHLIVSLQSDPRTASRPDGMVGGDTTQVEKRFARKMPGVYPIFLHSEKRFSKGTEIISTHYADGDKDYSLFMSFYEPDEAAQAAKQAQQARKKAGVNGRKPQEVMAYIQQQVTVGQAPDMVVLKGNRLTKKFRLGMEALSLTWIGISDNRRTYQLEGEKEKRKAKALLAKAKNWVDYEGVSYRFANIGAAASTVGTVRLIGVEHIVEGVRTLYVVSDKVDWSTAVNNISLLLAQEEETADKGILQQMLELLHLGREAGIRAENAAFDSWFCIPWFILAVLELGFKRVVTKPRHNFNYHYRGQTYKLQDLWSLLHNKDFQTHTVGGLSCQLASLIVSVNGLGQVKLVFVRQPARRSSKMLQTILLCTDIDYPNKKVLRTYRLRWRIEVCYREVKQNHKFGQFHAQNMETNYGQTMLSLVAYLFVSLFRLLLPPLRFRSLGWIKEFYLRAIVRLTSKGNVIEFPGWLIDIYGLPDWDSFIIAETL